jgi:hypothetical protein
MCWRDVFCGTWLATLGGETFVCTLWGAIFSLSSWGASLVFACFGFADTKKKCQSSLGDRLFITELIEWDRWLRV